MLHIKSFSVFQTCIVHDMLISLLLFILEHSHSLYLIMIVLYWFASTDDLVLTISCFWNKLALTELTSESFSSVTPNVILQINFAWEISFTICALVRVHSSMNIHVSPESRGSVKLFSTQIALSGSSWSWPPLWCRHHHHLEVRNVIS